MTLQEKKSINLSVMVKSPIERVWELWTEPQHIMRWNNASDDWHTSRAENDLNKGGKFSYLMEAKDGSSGFEFEGNYNVITPLKVIGYTIADGRRVNITFSEQQNGTKISESFEAEGINSIEMQREGWQAILNNFKKYAESAT
jgi:uncharacterized protein YndB with AHSA1/START domain